MSATNGLPSDPYGPTTDRYGETLAARLYEQLLPFQTFGGSDADPDEDLDLWALCDGIYAMFQQVELLTTQRDDGLSGWANMLDIWNVISDYLPYLAQFVGTGLASGLSDEDQRNYIYSLPGFNRCRPATIIAAVKTTLTGTQFVQLYERQTFNPTTGNVVPNAWRYTIVTKPSETPNPAATIAAIQSQKPGMDQFTWYQIENITYGYLALTYSSYTSMQAQYSSYTAMKNAPLS